MLGIGITQGAITAQQQRFQTRDLPEPVATDNDVVVSVQATSVNPVDTKIRQTTQQRALKILGYDAVGTITQVGDAVTDFQVGDRVFYAGSNQRPGANAEQQLVDARLISRAPESLTDAEAAALPLTMLTAYELLFEKFHQPFAAGANQGKTVLIINGAGGVGSAAIQLAKWAGFTVITTASRPETIAWVQQLGADQVLDHHQDLLAQLGPDAVNNIDDVMILHNTEPYFKTAAQLVKPLGHVGSIVESRQPLPLGLLKDKAASFDWEFMFAKAKYQVDLASQGAFLGKLAQLVDSGAIRSTLTKTLTEISPATLQEAHALVEGGHMLGKVVLTAPFKDAEPAE